MSPTTPKHVGPVPGRWCRTTASDSAVPGAIRGRSTHRGLILALAVLAVAASIPAPAAALSASACVVRNVSRSQVTRNLPQAVRAAEPGDRLTVRGVCPGAIVIDRDLTITGVRPPRATRPTLSGVSQLPLNATTLTVLEGVEVRIARLVITGGTGSPCADTRRCGAGIWNHGGLTLTNVVVTGNGRGRLTPYQGGGIYNDGGDLRLAGTTTIRDNLAWDGGGLYSAGGRVEIADRAGIRNNAATWGGGVRMYGGDLSLADDAQIAGNSAETSGGGLYVGDAIIALNDRASIAGNTADGDGGGVYLSGTSLALTGAASISGNRSGARGAGVLLLSGTLSASADTRISANTAVSGGGGVHVFFGTLDPGMCGSRIDGNTPTDCVLAG